MVKNSEAYRLDGTRRYATLLKIFGIFAVVIAVGLSLWYLASGPASGSRNVASSPVSASTIRLTYPTDWKVITLPTSIPGVASNAIIVLQRRDKSGVLVVLPGGKAPPFDASTSRKISSLLAKQYADYKFVRAAVVHLGGEAALFFTYLRTKQGDLHTITILPVGQKSFIIDTASPSTSAKLGVEIGKILKSPKITSSL